MLNISYIMGAMCTPTDLVRATIKVSAMAVFRAAARLASELPSQKQTGWWNDFMRLSRLGMMKTKALKGSCR